MDTHPHYIAKRLHSFSRRLTNPLIGCFFVAVLAHSLIGAGPTPSPMAVPVILGLYALAAAMLIAMVAADAVAAVIILFYDAFRGLKREFGHDLTVSCDHCVTNFAEHQHRQRVQARARKQN